MNIPHNVFILEPSATGIDIHLLPDGSVALYCGTYLSSEQAKQIKHGLMAILSGNFSRATTEAYLAFDLLRRAPRTSRSDSPESPPATLDML